MHEQGKHTELEHEPEPLFGCNVCAAEYSKPASDLRIYDGELWCWDCFCQRYEPEENTITDWNELDEFVPAFEHRIAELEDEIKIRDQLKLASLKYGEETNFDLDMSLEGETAKGLIIMLVEMLRQNEAENYLALSIEMDGRKYGITIQDCNGKKTPAQDLVFFKQRNAELVRALEDVTSQLERQNPTCWHNIDTARTLLAKEKEKQHEHD